MLIPLKYVHVTIGGDLLKLISMECLFIVNYQNDY